MSVLLLGYGNPARRDDGLGPAFAEEGGRLGLDLTVDSNYQLAAEDAETLSRHDQVVLVDATTDGPEPFGFERLQSEPDWSISTHSISPGALLALTREAFGREPECFVLGIRGYQFEHFTEDLTPAARANLEKALVFFQSWLRDTGRTSDPAAGKEER